MITTNENTYNYINLDYMDMMSDGDDDMKKVMLDMLFEELPMEVKKMRSLCGQQDWKKLNEVAHKMKSTLAFVGNPAMTSANKDIEQFAKAGEELAKIPDLIGVMEELCPMALAELKSEHERL